MSGTSYPPSQTSPPARAKRRERGEGVGKEACYAGVHCLQQLWETLERSVREHLSRLQQRIQDLNLRIMENWCTKMESNRIEAEIRAARLAIDHYRKALELERQLN